MVVFLYLLGILVPLKFCEELGTLAQQAHLDTVWVQCFGGPPSHPETLLGEEVKNISPTGSWNGGKLQSKGQAGEGAPSPA